MKKFLGVSAAVVAAMTVSAAANAAPFVIDDFTLGAADQEVTQASTTSVDPVTGRSLSINVLQSLPPAGDPYGYVDLTANQMRIGNGSGENSEVTLAYDPIIKNFVTSITITVERSDAGVGALNSIELFLDGVAVAAGAATFADTITTTDITIALTAAEAANLGDLDGAALSFLFTGPDDFDLTISAITASVPEPAALALFGLGLVGLGVARRRRTI